MELAVHILAPVTLSKEVTDLFDRSVIKQNRARTVINEQHGFECFSVRQGVLK